MNKIKFLVCILLLFVCDRGVAQTDNLEESGDALGPFLLDLSYTGADTVEGIADVYSGGITWLARPDIRVGAVASFVSFDPIEEELPDQQTPESFNGIGDSMLFVQYDWQEQLTASPWIPDQLGTTLSLLIPTGEAKKFLGQDTWAASISSSWPVTIDSKWLVNPFLAYNFSFNAGPSALHWSVGEIGMNIVRLFPASFLGRLYASRLV